MCCPPVDEDIRKILHNKMCLFSNCRYTGWGLCRGAAWGMWSSYKCLTGCWGPHRAPANNLQTAKGRMYHHRLLALNPEWQNCDMSETKWLVKPCVTLTLRFSLLLHRGRTSLHLPGKATGKGTWVSLTWKCDSTSCCWLWAFTSSLQPQLLGTLLHRNHPIPSCH